jgi:hypothetical protein
MSQKLMDLAQQFLEPGEQILAAVAGQYEKPKPGGQKEHIRTCLLLATDRRVLFYAKKVTGHDVESFPYSLVSSIVEGKNLMGHNVQVIAPGHQVEVKWIKNAAELANVVKTARERMGQPAVPAKSETDPVEQLRKLGELRDAGIVTPEEFERKKEELLGRI